MFVTYHIFYTHLQGDVDGVDAFIGRRVRKDFVGHGEFDGVVTGVEVLDDGSDVNVFGVQYEDGDFEELYLDELTPILVPAPPQELEATREVLTKIRKTQEKPQRRGSSIQEDTITPCPHSPNHSSGGFPSSCSISTPHTR